MTRFTLTLCAVAVLALAAGCASEGVRIDANEEAFGTHEFNPKDLQLIADTVRQLIEREVLVRDETPAVYVATIRNRTDEHVNTEAISQKIAFELDRSGRIQLVERSPAKNEALAELEFQQSGYADPAKAQEVGRFVGAEYLLDGTLTSIAFSAGRKKGQFFQFTLTLVEVETLKSWKTQVEIQKVTTRGVFGW